MARNNALRGRWKPWTWSTRMWLLAIVFSAIASPIATRWICLWQIPDVKLPFDVENVVQIELPDDQNAFKVYDNVLKRLAGNRNTPANPGTSAPAAKSESRRDELFQRLSAHDEQALADYIRAGEMDRAVGLTINSITGWSDLELQQNLRKLARHYAALGQTFEECGEIEKAWACHRANLQASIHAEQPGIEICAYIGIGIRSISGESIVHWASNPSLTAAQIRAARNDIAREFARRVTFPAINKAEYLMVCNTLNEVEGAEFLIGEPTTKHVRSKLILYGINSLLWCVAERELTLRLYRQLLVNNANQLDKPIHLRHQSTSVKREYVFDFDPKVRRIPGQLDAAHLLNILKSDTRMLRMASRLLPGIERVDRTRQYDSSRLAALTVLFAAQEFQRSHGQFPASIEELVPTYLDEAPLDPLDQKGLAMRFRKEADGTAIVWSVGQNGIDDQGDVEPNNNADVGYTIKVRASRYPQSSEGNSNAEKSLETAREK